MNRLALAVARVPLQVLAIGSHPDDIEIGCGGTILHLIDTSPAVEVCWIVLAAHGERADEARRSAASFLEGAVRRRVVLQSFRDGFLPYDGAEVKAFLQEVKDSFAPDVIFTHHGSDLHQDHRLVCEATRTTFRDHLILEYEIPKYDGDFGAPNVFVHLTDETCRRKVAGLLSGFPTQRRRRWFTEDLFYAALRLRGMESNSPTRHAEAFYCRKLVLA